MRSAQDPIAPSLREVSGPLKVLHLEDSPHDKEMIAQLLRENDLQCAMVLATNRREFESALARESFDLLLCDYNLPGYNGTAALAAARRIQPDVPVILISGTLDEAQAVECLHLGACDYLIKERLHRLGPAVRRALQEAGEQRARRAAEEALRVSEERFRRLVEDSLDLICETALTGSFLYTSPNFHGLLGYLPSDIVHRDILDFVHAEDQALVKRNLTEREIRVDFRFRHRDGSYRWIEMTGRVIEYPGGEARLGLMGRDATERRHLEEQLRQAQKLESIGQLAGGVAHDFNNILTIICGYSALLLEELELPSKVREGIREVLETANRATNLTRQLLAFSRKQMMQRTALDLNPVVQEMSRMLARTLGAEITLRFEAAENLPPIYADRGMMEQILLNLAVNARDAMPDGGCLTISTARATTHIPSEVDAAFEEFGLGVELCVSDTGSGIPPEVMPRIFEAFFTTKDVHKGTGLGLATVQSIVRDHHGTIKVESEVGAGTAFTLLFPATKLSKSTVEPAEKECLATAGTGSVMVVEDEPAVRALMETILHARGYELLSAGSGKQALALLEQRKQPIDLLLTDISLPEGISGEELAARARRLIPQLHVIYSSGHRVDVLNDTLDLGDDIQFLPKPFTPAQLLAAVHRGLAS